MSLIRSTVRMQPPARRSSTHASRQTGLPGHATFHTAPRSIFSLEKRHSGIVARRHMPRLRRHAFLQSATAPLHEMVSEEKWEGWWRHRTEFHFVITSFRQRPSRSIRSEVLMAMPDIDIFSRFFQPRYIDVTGLLSLPHAAHA